MTFILADLYILYCPLRYTGNRPGFYEVPFVSTELKDGLALSWSNISEIVSSLLMQLDVIETSHTTDVLFSIELLQRHL